MTAGWKKSGGGGPSPPWNKRGTVSHGERKSRTNTKRYTGKVKGAVRSEKGEGVGRKTKRDKRFKFMLLGRREKTQTGGTKGGGARGQR